MRGILGISAFYHDSAAALLVDGKLVAAAQEERFTRKRHDSSFPTQAAKYCLREWGAGLERLDAVVYYDKPILTFDRILETYLHYAPQGWQSFSYAIPLWLKQKIFMRQNLERHLSGFLSSKPFRLPKMLFCEHHESHAASAFYPSPFNESAVLCLDGVGEWSTTTGWMGQGSELTPLWTIKFPHSIGLLYSAMTEYLGFKVNSGEFKLMGLAPYGKPTYVNKIVDHLIDVKPDGSFRLNMTYFSYCAGLKMTNRRFAKLFDGEVRQAESAITQKHCDLAHSIQVVVNDVMIRLANKLHRDTGCENLCLAGGVALNCVANSKVLSRSSFKTVWVQPAPGDAGGAVGCAYASWHKYFRQDRLKTLDADSMSGAFLGPQFNAEEIEQYLASVNASFELIEDETLLLQRVVDDLIKQKVVGWFYGRMEFGPRALGARSILADPRSQAMQSILNHKVKRRETFRPFAPTVLREMTENYFDLKSDSPYMSFTAQTLDNKRPEIPAVTHIDGSARVQTTHPQTNSRFHALLRQFWFATGCGVLINTSFNVRGEPIVCTPSDAYRCFLNTDIDTLVLENFILKKSCQNSNTVEKIRYDLD